RQSRGRHVRPAPTRPRCPRRNGSSEQSRRPRTRARKRLLQSRFQRPRCVQAHFARPLRSAAPRLATVPSVSGGLNRILLATAVAVAVLVVPSTALAKGCGGGASAGGGVKEGGG